MRTSFAAAALLILAAASASAQSRLPRVSPSEQSYSDYNRSIERVERQRSIERQNQFEVNQLRQEQSRQQLFAPPPNYGVGRICAPGQLAC